MNMEINEKVVFLREKRQISQIALAEKMKVSVEQISKWEKNEETIPMEQLIPLAKALCISVEELLLKQPSMDEPERKKLGKKLMTVLVTQGTKEAMKIIEQMIAKYPQDGRLKIMAASTLFMTMVPEEQEAAQKIDLALQLLNQVIAEGEGEVKRSAVFTKATLLLMIDEPQECEKILDDQHWNVIDPCPLYAAAYEQQGKHEQLNQLAAKLLLQYLNQACSMGMTLVRCCDEPLKQLAMLQSLAHLESEFKIGQGSAALQLCRECLKQDEKKQAGNYLIQSMEALMQHGAETSLFFESIESNLSNDTQAAIRLEQLRVLKSDSELSELFEQEDVLEVYRRFTQQ